MTDLERLQDLCDRVAGGYAGVQHHLAELDLFGPALQQGTELVLAPAARLAVRALPELQRQGGKVVALCDRDKAMIGAELHGVPVLSYQDCRRLFPAATVLVGSAIHDSAITESCLDLGFERVCSYPVLAHNYPKMFGTKEFNGLAAAVFEAGAMDRVRQLFDELADEESRTVLLKKIEFYLTARKSLLDSIRSPHDIYFDPSIVSINDKTIYVDAGAYKGDTLSTFLAAGALGRQYVAFEPDPLCFTDLTATAKPLASRFVHVPAGLYRTTDTLRLVASGAGDSHIENDRGSDVGDVISIDVVALDDYFVEREPPTFIKMDIEGAESDALIGGAKTIATARPQLAISVYHSPADLWNLPLRMMKMLPNSKIYLRHYTRELCDTVCYVIPE